MHTIWLTILCWRSRTFINRQNLRPSKLATVGEISKGSGFSQRIWNNIRTEFLRNFRRRKFSLLVFSTYFHAAKRYKRGGNNPKAFDCFEMKKNTWTSVIKHNLLKHSILFTCVDCQELSWKKYSLSPSTEVCSRQSSKVLGFFERWFQQRWASYAWLVHYTSLLTQNLLTVFICSQASSLFTVLLKERIKHTLT